MAMGNGKSRTVVGLLEVLVEQSGKIVEHVAAMDDRMAAMDDRMASIEKTVASVAVDVAAIKDAHATDFADHEVRIRELERRTSSSR
jgi:hypothetical protein